MKTKIILTASLLFTALTIFAGPPTDEGKTLFTARCAACHNVNKILVGPALAGVNDRRSMDWIVKFVHSPRTIIKSGDPYAVTLFDKFKVQMPDHPDLTADNIRNIVEYIKTEAKAGTANSARQAEPLKKETNYVSLVLANKGLLVSAFALVVLLIAALWFLGITRKMRSKTV